MRSFFRENTIYISIDCSIDASNKFRINGFLVHERLNVESVGESSDCPIELVPPYISSYRTEHLQNHFNEGVTLAYLLNFAA